jgi:hypothetical protein
MKLLFALLLLFISAVTAQNKCSACKTGCAIYGISSSECSYRCRLSCSFYDTKVESDGACICSMHYAPVCTADGKKFTNVCHAKCKGVTDTTPCKSNVTNLGDSLSEKLCICPKIFSQVCGKDGRRYPNACEAKCYDVDDVEPCPPIRREHVNSDQQLVQEKCICPKIYSPVCTKDGKLFSNACQAKCHGVTVTHKCIAIFETKSDRSCMCPAVYLPVCANGVTYSNRCSAECRGVQNAQRCNRTPKSQSKVCRCPLVHRPVCSRDGRKFSNACRAKCAGVNETQPCILFDKREKEAETESDRAISEARSPFNPRYSLTWCKQECPKTCDGVETCIKECSSKCTAVVRKAMPKIKDIEKPKKAFKKRTRPTKDSNPKKPNRSAEKSNKSITNNLQFRSKLHELIANIFFSL